MNMTLNKRWCLTAILALSAVVYTSSSYAATDRLVIESGDSAQSVSRRRWKKSNGTTPAACARR
ncbi:putative secreted protein [Klebsiella pneumoniae IS22]|nr:putative secreted protein [Klebsiella pneumoniae IS22]